LGWDRPSAPRVPITSFQITSIRALTIPTGIAHAFDRLDQQAALRVYDAVLMHTIFEIDVIG